ncbi:hypothetical protein FACS189454_02780 [Planctomycetales bacterium]|nr:hypothetical protein FACS189454_02780 [Planctomycetales bacterium]
MNTIIEQARNGDTAAFAKIVKQYQAVISGVLFNVTGDFHKSEDLAQETFLIAWKKLADLQNTDDILPWLCTIARNLANRSFRKQQPLNQSGYGGEIAGNQSSAEHEPSNEMIRREQSEMVWAAVAEIPESQRETLVLFYRTGQSIHEIAAATASTEDAVKQKLYRARLSLKSKLEEMIGDVLASTAPGETFTLGVMAAVTGVMVMQTSAVATAAVTTSAAAKTAIGTGSAATGETIGFAALWSMFGFLSFLVWEFAFIFASFWMVIQNMPTLRARRYHVHLFFLLGQYFPLFIAALTFLTCFGLVWGWFFGTPFRWSLPVQLLINVGIPAVIGNSIGCFCRFRSKKIIESDLGLWHGKVKEYSYPQVERRFYWSLITNVIILETVLVVQVLPQLLGDLLVYSRFLYWSLLGFAVLSCLFIYTAYVFGLHFLKLCRSPASMIEYPPLIDKPFETMLGRKMVNPILMKYNKETKSLFWLNLAVGMGCVCVLLWEVAMLNWQNNPILTAVCVIAVAIGLAAAIFVSPRYESPKQGHLFNGWVALGVAVCFYILACVEINSYALSDFWHNISALPSQSDGHLLSFISLVASIIFVTLASIICFVWYFWLRNREASAAGIDYTNRLQEAIAQYAPTGIEDEPETPAFPTRKWFWICFLYGAILLIGFAVFR